MNFKIFCGFVVFVFAVAMPPAQTKVTSSGKCGKTDVQQSIPAGDHEGHRFMLESGKCVTKGEITGAQRKEGAFAEHREVTGNHIEGGGAYVETFGGGDKVF